jgi:predicted nucleic acid-binding protein
MTWFVDTSVWSLAFRRDVEVIAPQVQVLKTALERGDSVVSTGLVLQEVLQGFVASKSRRVLMTHFSALPFINPSRQDHMEAALLRDQCRQQGVQLGTIDALIAQLCIANNLILLSTDMDFAHAAKYCALRNWKLA